MSKIKQKVESKKCMICGKKLNLKTTSGGIGFGDQIFEQFEQIEHTAYKCRNCGAMICMNCAKVSRCVECGGNIFDRAVG